MAINSETLYTYQTRLVCHSCDTEGPYGEAMPSEAYAFTKACDAARAEDWELDARIALCADCAPNYKEPGEDDGDAWSGGFADNH